MNMHLAPAKSLAGVRVVELMAMGPQTDPVRECARLEAILKPATREECAVSLKNLRLQFAEREPDDAAEARIVNEGYLEAMRGHPKWAVIEACRAFVRGAVEGASTEFMPKAATLGAEIQRRLDDWRGKLQRARRAVEDQQTFAGEHHGPLSPETKALGQAYLARARARVEEERRTRMGPRVRAPEWVDPNPITAEMLADVPDAPPRGAGMPQVRVPDEFKSLKGRRP